MQDDGNTTSSEPISRKQFCVGLVAAGGFFGYLAVATILHENPTVRLLMIGPYGISAGIWLGGALLVLGLLARREQRQLER
jgi:hypothetical protein